MVRIILLGASNLTLSFPSLMEALRQRFQAGVQVLAAHGHGRSYGTWSRVLFRALPGIKNCRLWEDLDRLDTQPTRTYALLTDVGNDILYGIETDRIADWVHTCLSRLERHRAQTVLALLPLCSVRRLSAWRYHLTKACFFPASSLSYSQMRDRAEALNDALLQLGTRCGMMAHRSDSQLGSDDTDPGTIGTDQATMQQETGAFCEDGQAEVTLSDASTRSHTGRGKQVRVRLSVVQPQADWYGFDPIHIRRSKRAEAWEQIVSSWFQNSPTLALTPVSFFDALRTWRLEPAERRLLGRRRVRNQPTLDRSDGTQIYLY